MRAGGAARLDRSIRADLILFLFQEHMFVHFSIIRVRLFFCVFGGFVKRQSSPSFLPSNTTCQMYEADYQLLGQYFPSSGEQSVDVNKEKVKQARTHG